MGSGSKKTAYSDAGCAVADSGAQLGLLTVGGGTAKFAVRTGSAVPTPRDLDATDIDEWTFAVSAGVFSTSYTKAGNVFRANVTADATATGPIRSTPVLLGGGAMATASEAVAFDAQGTEPLAVQSEKSVLYARPCAGPR